MDLDVVKDDFSNVSMLKIPRMTTRWRDLKEREAGHIISSD